MVYQLKFVVAIFPLSNTLKSLNISIGKFVDSDLQKIVSIVKPSFVKNYLGAIQIIMLLPDKKSLPDVRQVL